ACIAVSLKKRLPNSIVYAGDISIQALEVAKRNAIKNNVKLELRTMDILKCETLETPKFNLIVSNPPYVCHSEKLQMQANVLNYEPHSALFVEDNNPLIFYEALAKFAKNHLFAYGFLLVEINALFGKETMHLFQNYGFVNIKLKTDIHGRDRMIAAQYCEQ
ncbi:MAG: N5-glutamine methyltransferase family protein, partial [Bacteroidales bacterium]